MGSIMHTFRNHELDPKVSGHNSHHMKFDMSKVDIKSEREGKHGIASPIESKSCEQTDASQYSYSPALHSSPDIEDFSKGDQNVGQLMEVTRSFAASKIGVVEEETNLHARKTLAKIELPERIACITDGACYTVKDICIDERVHSLEIVLVESNIDQNISSRFNHYASTGKYDMTKDMTDGTEEMTDDVRPISHGLKSSSENEQVDKDNTQLCLPGSLLTGGGMLDRVAPSVETSSEKQSLPLREFDADPWQVHSSIFYCINDQKQPIDQQNIGQGTLEEKNSTVTALLSSATESNQSNGIKGDPANAEVESGVITFHFDSGSVTVSGREESKKYPDNQQSEQDRCVPKTEEVTHEGATGSVRSSFIQHGYGDSSFFEHASVSGPIASSGHIPYSGSISLRSESSTTSAHSFAFPVLQTEWNSSPIRMAKAERRHRRKLRGWKKGLLCCRF